MRMVGAKHKMQNATICLSKGGQGCLQKKSRDYLGIFPNIGKGSSQFPEPFYTKKALKSSLNDSKTKQKILKITQNFVFERGVPKKIP